MTPTTRPRFDLGPAVRAVRGGRGPNMVLLHGVGLNADAWYAMQPQLEENFTVTAIDMPGHGESAGLPLASTPNLEDFTDAIAGTFERFDQPAIVVGHSMGALIALDLAVRYGQRVAAAIPLNVIHRRSPEAAHAVRARAAELSARGAPDLDPTLNRWFGKDPQATLLEANDACRAMLQATNPAGYAAAYRAFAECDGPSEAQLGSVSQPVLCMTGEKEPNSTPRMSETVANLVPNGECRIVDDAHHMMPITHAAEVNARILRFLQRRGLATSRPVAQFQSSPKS